MHQQLLGRLALTASTKPSSVLPHSLGDFHEIPNTSEALKMAQQNGGSCPSTVYGHPGETRKSSLVCTYAHTHTLWGESKLEKMACSSSLAPHFANDGCVMAESLCRAAHEHHEAPAWSRVVCGDMLCYGCWYGCSTSQRSTNVSAGPPRISFQPLSLHLAYHAFSE